MNERKDVTLYTDGACIGNPGPGGYAAVLLYGKHRKELSGGYLRTTNNRMELLAVVMGLMALKMKCHVTVYSDSRYVVDAMNKGWARRWHSNGWKRNKSEKAVNPDIWAQLISFCDYHDVEFKWVRGHTGNSENERCDQLANEAAQQSDLPADQGYIHNEDSSGIRST